MRFCYQIHSHRSPEQIHRLTATIKRYSPDSFVLISHDRAGATLDIASLEAMPDVAVLLHDAEYGSYTSVQRYVSSLKWMIDEGVEADWVVNLSGEDYPLVPPDLAEQEVVDSGADGFMEHWEMLGPDAHWPRRRVISRYYYQHRLIRPLTAKQKQRLRPIQAVNRVQPFFRLHVAYGLVLGTRGDAPFGPDLRLYGGSNFATLSWPLAAYLHEYLEAHPELVDYFRVDPHPRRGRGEDGALQRHRVPLRRVDDRPGLQALHRLPQQQAQPPQVARCRGSRPRLRLRSALGPQVRLPDQRAVLDTLDRRLEELHASASGPSDPGPDVAARAS